MYVTSYVVTSGQWRAKLTNNTETNNERRRPAIGESATRTDEQTGPNDTGQGHHGQVTILEAALNTGVGIMEIGVAVSAVGTINGLLPATRVGFRVVIVAVSLTRIAPHIFIHVPIGLLIPAQHDGQQRKANQAIARPDV